MTLSGSFETLDRAAVSLHNAFAAARATIYEDTPIPGRTLMVDELRDAMLELSSDAEQIMLQVRAVADEPDRPRVQLREALVRSQQCLHAIADGLADRVMDPELVDEVTRVCRRGGREWRGWWSAAATGIEECTEALRPLRDALFECWQELADSAGVHMDEVRVGRLSIAQPRPAERRSGLACDRSANSVEVASAGEHETRGEHR